jgi:hypothetical protein
MIQKAISLFTAAVILSVYLWSQLRPSDALFLFATNNLIVNILLLGLAAMMVKVSFIDRFRQSWTYLLTAGGAVFCLLVGAAGLFSSGIDYKFYSFFGPIDFIFLTEAGIVLAIAALSYKHQPVSLTQKSLRLPRPPVSRPSIVLPRAAYNSLKTFRIG